MRRLLPLLPLTVFIACILQSTGLSMNEAILTLTATAITPTITSTPAPHTAGLVDTLNRNLIGADPLGETVDARYFVIDLVFLPDDKNDLVTMCVHMECECVFSTCCSDERTFVQLVRAIVADPATLAGIQAELPATLRELKMIAFDRMQQKGVIVVQWSDLLLYASGQINGNQLGSRIVRVSP